MRFFAPVIFASTLAIAGMSATVHSPLAAQQDSARVEPLSLGDVQIGERGNQTRIAFLCKGLCSVEKRGGANFFLKGAAATFDLDLVHKSDRLRTLKAQAAADGAAIHIESDGVIEYASVNTCTVGGIEAACLDLFFEEEDVSRISRADQQTPSLRDSDNQKLPPSNTVRQTAQHKPVRTAALPEKPVLRESQTQRFQTFAHFAAPERLAPPAGAILAKVQPIERTVTVAKPSVVSNKPLVEPVKVDFVTRVRAILGKNLTTAYCNNAGAALKADAWALGAMVDVGLCAAARGDLVQADATLARLLQYTPDNYEALVGRALIAELAEEKGVARKYYQDALNALPPIEESNRIVQAMNALK